MADNEVKPVSDKLDLKPIADGFDIDVSHWKMKQHKAWNRVATTGDPDKINELMSQAIVSTPYEGFNPRLPDNYDELEPKQWKACIEAVSAALYNAFLA